MSLTFYYSKTLPTKLTGFLFSLIGLVLISSQSYGATAQWTGSVDSDWDNIANWSTTPNGNNVVIDPANYTGASASVDLTSAMDAGMTANKITISGGAQVKLDWDFSNAAGKDLIIQDAGTVVTISAGILAFGNKITVKNNASLIITGGTVSTVNDLEFLSSATCIMGGGTLTIDTDGGNLFLIDQGGTFTHSGGTINVTAGMKIDRGGIFNMNEDTTTSALNVTTDLLIKDFGTGVNSLFNLDAGTAIISGVMQLNGNNGGTNPTLDISGGSFTLTDSAIWMGTDIDTPKVLISGGIVLFSANVVNQDTAVDNVNMYFDISGGTTTFQGNLEMNDGGNDDIFNQSGGTIKFEGTKTWDNEGTFTATGGIVQFDGKTTLTDGSAGTGSYTFYDMIIVSGDTIIQGASAGAAPTNINITHNYTNIGGYFNANSNQVTFNGTTLQTLTLVSSDLFYDLVVNNSGSYLSPGGHLKASNSITMTQGNIDLGSDTLTLGTGTGNVGTLLHTSGTVIGKFQRWINATGTKILFPVGTSSNFNPDTIIFVNLTSGSLINEFVATDPGSSGLPLAESGLNVTNQFPEGYWSVTAANSLASTDYKVRLTGNGFTTYTKYNVTRVIKRLNGGSSWTLDGAHVDLVDPLACRNGLSGISTAHFGFGHTDCALPTTTISVGTALVCASATGVVYSTTSPTTSTYTWVVTGGTANPAPGLNDTSITVDWGVTGGAGSVMLSETTNCGNRNSDTYAVTIDTSTTTSAITGDNTVCENILAESYSVTNTSGYSYTWMITGGTQVSGGTTNSITVDWGAQGAGDVSVTASNGGCTEAPVNLPVTKYGITSSAVSQLNTTAVAINSTGNEILKIQIVGATVSCDTLTKFYFHTGGNPGSTDPANDISDAKVYYTGTTATFSTGTLFGSLGSSPNGSFVVTGSQSIPDASTVYFWLSYDIAASPTLNNNVDAKLDSFEIDGSTTITSMTTPDPSGKRTLKDVRFSVATGAWNTTATWSTVSGGSPGASVPVVGNDVVIENGYTVTVTTTQVCDSISIIPGTGAADTKLIVDDNGTLTVNSGVLVSTELFNKNALIDIMGTGGTPGQLTIMGGLFVKGYSAMNDARITSKESGQLTVNGDISLWTDGGTKQAQILAKNASTVTVTGNIVFEGAASNMSEFRLANTALLNIAGGFVRSGSNYGALNTDSTAFVNFNGTAAQTVALIDYATGDTWKYGEVRINNTAGITLDAHVTASNVNDDIRVQTGTFHSGGFDITLNGATVFEVDSNATYSTTTTNAEGGMALAGTHDIDDSSTVIFAASGAQNIVIPMNPVNAWDYGNVTLTGSSSKTIADNNIDINGDLTITSGDILNTGNNNFTLAGDFINPASSGFICGTGTVTMDGSVTQTITNPDNFYGLTVNKAAGNLETSGSITASNTLTMTQGNIDLGTDIMTLGTGTGNVGTLSHASGTVIGKFQRWINATATDILYPVGTSTSYNPDTINFTNLTSGSLICEFIAGV